MRDLPTLVARGLAGVLLAVSVAACSSSDSGGGPAGAEVRLADFAFEPDELTVAAGDRVTFTNRDQATHTATASGGGPIDSPDLDPGATYEVTFDEAGTYEYLCKFHPFMTGTVTVTG